MKTLQQFIGAYRDTACPSRLGYDLRAIALRLVWTGEKDNPLPGIHAAELARTLDGINRERRAVEGEMREVAATGVPVVMSLNSPCKLMACW